MSSAWGSTASSSDPISGSAIPELPETETIARDLDRAVAGSTIVGVRVRHADVLREVSARTLTNRITGTTILRAWRRAKLVVLDLSSGDRLVVQPRFTGAVLINPSDERYVTVTFQLDDGRVLLYRDVRRLGTVALMTPKRFEAYAGALGIEPLDSAFTSNHLSQLLARSRQAVKKVLMDQAADRRDRQHLRERSALARRYRSVARGAGRVSATEAVHDCGMRSSTC